MAKKLLAFLLTFALILSTIATVATVDKMSANVKRNAKSFFAIKISPFLIYLSRQTAKFQIILQDKACSYHHSSGIDEPNLLYTLPEALQP